LSKNPLLKEWYWDGEEDGPICGECGECFRNPNGTVYGCGECEECSDQAYEDGYGCEECMSANDD